MVDKFSFKTVLDIGFENLALNLFAFQAKNNLVYNNYINYLGVDNQSVKSIDEIPFLPIQFFKTHRVIVDGCVVERTFKSSGTTGQIRSQHHIVSSEIYKDSFTSGFNYFFGNPKDFVVLALLPSYIEQGDSSLVYMVDLLIEQSNRKESGFYLNDYQKLADTLLNLEKQKQPTILIGVSYALLDLLDYQRFNLKYTIVMETGGMKGRRKELLKEELHGVLKNGFGVSCIYSEYGMTELLSQAYAMGGLLYKPVPWMKVLIREIEDPFHFVRHGVTGGINIIDLANHYSCSFIETQDLGKVYTNGSFEIIGRFDHSDIRGCNLMFDKV